MGNYVGWSIWKEFDSDFGDVDEADFLIHASTHGKIIYSGHAVRQPGQETLKVRINDICADYIRQYSNSLPITKEGSNTIFVVINTSVSPNKIVDSVSFIWDWSYKSGIDFSSKRLLSAPVSQFLGRGQYVVLSYYRRNDALSREIPYSIGTADGNSNTYSLRQMSKLDADADFLFPFPLPVGPNYVYNYSPDEIYGAEGIEYVDFYPVMGSVNTVQRYYMDRECHEYALYYINAFGGWDTLLLRGRVSVEMDVDRHTYTLPGTMERRTRGTVNYLNEIGATYTLRTGWLTEEGAANIWHLTGSTDVYLCYIPTDEWTPLVLADKSTQIKTYGGEGGRMISYEFKASAARKGVRR